MSYVLGSRSRERLAGVEPDLVGLVERALELSTVDFTVLEGVRSYERQRRLYDSGASQTLRSRHLTGHAVDLGAWVDGEVRWDWPLYYKIAEAVQEASLELGLPVRWGGCWQLLSAIGDPEEAVLEYAARCQAQGRRAFMDGPHYEIPRLE